MHDKGGKAEGWERQGSSAVEGEFRTFLNFDRIERVILLFGGTHALVACPRCGETARALAKSPLLLLCPRVSRLMCMPATNIPWKIESWQLKRTYSIGSKAN
jgi:hypothetical protein